MDSEKEQASTARLETETTRNAAEASNSSLDSSEPSGGVRGSKRRRKTAVNPPDSDKCGSGTGAPGRVTRGRRAAALRNSYAEDAVCAKTPARLQRARGSATPARPRSSNALVIQ